jgi:Spy/CpxP family protein refolding chaperone
MPCTGASYDFDHMSGRPLAIHDARDIEVEHSVMNRFALSLSLVALIVSAAAAGAQHASPYAGQEQRSIKALSEEEVRDLLEGRGMALAKAAELNGYPGPMHVLEMADRLELSAAQRRATEALVAAVRHKARALGVQIVEAERDLDRAFAGGRIDATDLRTRVNAIAALQGELRAVHLEAHLAERSLLSPEQIARYNAARGYATARPHGH